MGAGFRVRPFLMGGHMARAKATDGTMKVKLPDTVSDGEGGFLAVGDTFTPADEEAAKALKDKGAAE